MDHTTERAEKVVNEVMRQFGKMLHEWVHDFSGSETVTLDELEETCEGDCSL